MAEVDPTEQVELHESHVVGELTESVSVNADSPMGEITTALVRRAYASWAANQEAIGGEDVSIVIARVNKHSEDFDQWLEAQRG